MNSSPATLRDVCTQHGVPISKGEKEMKSLPMQYCVKSVRIRSFSGPYFPTFGLYTERYETSKYGPEKLQIPIFFTHYDIFINNRNKHYASFRTLAYSQPGFVIPFSGNQVLSNQWRKYWRKICDLENKHIYFAFWLRSVSTILVNFS